MSSRLSLFERDCFSGELGSAAAAVVDRALSGKGGYACLANVHVAMAAEHDERLRRALASAWHVFPDGAPIAWLERRSGATDTRRIAGPDLFAAVLDLGRGVNLRHFFFGSTPAVLSALEERVRARFPGVEIGGAIAPPRGEERFGSHVGEIALAEPHVVWVALGAPKQELWMADHALALEPALVVGVGAAFDFHAGLKARAPRWMQDSGLEWLHRLATEPRRLGWRYLSTNTQFALAVLRSELRLPA